jgi:hypothetical protein
VIFLTIHGLPVLILIILPLANGGLFSSVE